MSSRLAAFGERGIPLIWGTTFVNDGDEVTEAGGDAGFSLYPLGGRSVMNS